MLDIRLLGSPVITVDGETIEVDTRKAIGLIAYLAVEGAVDRDAIAGLFWADSSPDRARGALRRTLSSVRSAIGTEALSADRNRVELAPGYRADIELFDAAIEVTTQHDHHSDEVCRRCIEPLTAASDLYRGDFLGTFSVRDAPDFEDWARPVTESYRLKAGLALQRLAMASAATGDYTAAIEAASRWIALDELHEPAYRLLMLLHAWTGDRAGAIETYRRAVAVLDRELGVSPLEETTELYEAVLDEDLPPAPAVRRLVRTVKSAEAPGANEMLDRRDAVERLRSALAQGRERKFTCLLTGDSWMGKTRLIEHLTQDAAKGGTATIPGRAYRAEERLPYGVAVQLMKPLLETMDHEDLPDWALEELARLDPKLGTGQTPAQTERLGQLRMWEAFLTLVETAARRRPTMITVDDAQWLDPASASLVAYLMNRLGDLPLLVVISARDLATLDPALRDWSVVADEHIHLEPLTPGDVLSDHPDVDADAIVETTGGIPLLVREAVESGSVKPDSATVTRYMEARRQRLSALAGQVMAAAAVLNGMCDPGLLRDTGGRTEEEIVEAVEELVAAGLLREHSDGQLGFTLDALESITYQSMSLARRRLLHRRAAEALEARARSRTDARVAMAIAGHLRGAGADEAADWYRRSGDLARAVFANTEAVSAYENAIALGHPDVGSLHLALGELAMARGDYQTATVELRAAASQSTGADLALVEHRIGDLNRLLGRFDLAEESFTRAKADHPEQGNLYADWALLRHRIGDDKGAMTMARTAHDAAEATGDDSLIPRTLNILGVVEPDPGEAMAHFEQALARAGATDPSRMAALNNRAHLLADSGDLGTAVSLVEEAIALADRAGYRHHQAALLNHLADLKHQSGQDQEAREMLTRAVTIFADIDAGDWEPEVWLLRQW